MSRVVGWSEDSCVRLRQGAKCLVKQIVLLETLSCITFPRTKPHVGPRRAGHLHATISPPFSRFPGPAYTIEFYDQQLPRSPIDPTSRYIRGTYIVVLKLPRCFRCACTCRVINSHLTAQFQSIWPELVIVTAAEQSQPTMALSFNIEKRTRLKTMGQHILQTHVATQPCVSTEVRTRQIWFTQLDLMSHGARRKIYPSLDMALVACQQGVLLQPKPSGPKQPALLKKRPTQVLNEQTTVGAVDRNAIHIETII